MSLLKESLIEAVETLEEVEKKTGVKLLTSGDTIISLAQTIYNNASKNRRTQEIAKEKQVGSAANKDKKASPKQITKLRSMLKDKIKGRKEQDQYLYKVFGVDSLDKITNQMAWPVINENVLPKPTESNPTKEERIAYFKDQKAAADRRIKELGKQPGKPAQKTSETVKAPVHAASPKQIAYLRYILSKENIKNTKKQDDYLLKFFKVKSLGQITMQAAWQATNKNLIASAIRGGA